MSTTHLPTSTAVDLLDAIPADVISTTTDAVLESPTAATTMVAFPVASPSVLPSSASTPVNSTSTASTDVSQTTRTTILASTVIGGIFLIALLAWAFHRRRIRQRRADRRRVQQELDATTKPRNRQTSLGDTDMAERQDVWYGQSRAIPTGLAERFRRKDAYIKATLGEAYPMHTAEDSSELLPAIPARALTKIDEDDAASTSSNRNSAVSGGDGKISPLPGRLSRMSDHYAQIHANMRSTQPPDRALEVTTRWSWTNSQAATTPRMYAPTLASSRASATRLRMAVNWVKTKGERITSGEAPRSASGLILPKPGVLKNQASKPNLAPRKLVKNSVRRSSHSLDVGKDPRDLHF